MVDCDTVTERQAGNLALAILSIRNSRGLSQAALGKLLSCTQNSISRYEKGEPCPSVPRLRKLLSLTANQKQSKAIFRELRRAGAILPHDLGIPQNAAVRAGEISENTDALSEALERRDG